MAIATLVVPGAAPDRLDVLAEVGDRHGDRAAGRDRRGRVDVDLEVAADARRDADRAHRGAGVVGEHLVEADGADRRSPRLPTRGPRSRSRRTGCEPSSSGSPSLPRHSPKPGCVAPAEVAGRDAPPVALPAAVHRQRDVHPHGRGDRGDRAGHGDVVATSRQQLVDLDRGLLRRRQELGVGGEVRHQPPDDVGVGRWRQGRGADAGRQRRRRHAGDRRRRRGGRWGRGCRRRHRRGRGRRRRGRWRRHRDGGRAAVERGRPIVVGAAAVVGGATVVGDGKRSSSRAMASPGVATADRPGDDRGDHDERQHGDDDEAAACDLHLGRLVRWAAVRGVRAARPRPLDLLGPAQPNLPCAVQPIGAIHCRALNPPRPAGSSSAAASAKERLRIRGAARSGVAAAACHARRPFETSSSMPHRRRNRPAAGGVRLPAAGRGRRRR